MICVTGEPEATTQSSSLWGQRKGGESENMFSFREDQRGRPDESKFDYHPLLRESKTTDDSARDYLADFDRIRRENQSRY